ncbi:amino acid transporter [Pullulanibacillus pueri]|uniref:Amino acid permease n=1 Tax=Pullulanibacillus pueri TaxID=1437324 RepID=A0A8J2ZU75_9BACL|nr:APC family permease [Pullulanibacillus pueri]MBM7681883.1 amino acid transporter [Pullulanibacillus pueri]GGH76460.1 amino acid permease [Pullulanibacillus pueri]
MEERAKLQKTLKPHWVWAVAFGSAIGWGCFVQPGSWMGTAGPLGAIIGLSIGALFMIVIGLSYGTLVKHFPVSGGEFAYAYASLGRTHAYICGWFLALGYLSIVALNASALALMVKYIFPGVVQHLFLYNVAGWHVYFIEILIASAALIVFGWLNIRGGGLSGLSQFIFCIILVIGVLLLGISLIVSPETSFHNLTPVFKPGTTALSGIIAMVAIAPWAFVGFDSIPQVAEEFNFAPGKALKLIIMALIAAGLVYSLMIFATAVAAPWQSLSGANTIWGTGDGVRSVLGNVGLLILAVALCMGIFTGLNGFIVSTSRLLFAMGRAQILPKAFAKLHPKYHTPYIGIIFTCAMCLIAPWFGRNALNWIVNMSSTGVTIAYFYCCFDAYKFFRWSENGKGTALVAPVKKAFSLLGAILSLVFLGLLLIPGSPAFLDTPAWIALGIWILLGALFYAVKGKEYRRIPKAQMDYLILGVEQPSNDDDRAS